jgi:hypothetical protein
MTKTISSMIQVQKIQSVKLAPYIILAFLWSFITTANAADQQEEVESPFSVLEEDIYTSNNNDIDIVKQPIVEEEPEQCDSAKIRFLDYNTGISTYTTIEINAQYDFNEKITISLAECKKDPKDILNPLNFAFITIKNSDQLIFEGWIFSKNTSVSLPKVDDKYIYLSNCNCENNNILKDKELQIAKSSNQSF